MVRDATMAPESPIDVGTAKVLLLDDALTAEQRGFRLTLNSPCRDSGPVLVPDRPWESGGIIGDSNLTVIDDSGTLRMWYMVPYIPDGGLEGAEPLFEIQRENLTGLDEKTRRDVLDQARYMLCYAESTDGVNWDKPDVGIYRFEGQRPSNMLFTARLGSTIFKDPTAPPAERYKMIYGGGPRLPHYHRAGNTFIRMAYTGVHGAFSADGLHWTPYPGPIMPWYTDTTNVCYWDDRIRKYVAFVRWDETMTYKNGETFRRFGNFYRAVGRSESEDFRRFPPPIKITQPTARELAPAWKRLELYNSSAVKYPFAADSYFMFPTYYHPASEMSDIHLAASRDGVNYARWPDPFVGLGQPDAFDSKMAHLVTGMILNGQEISMYYVGANYLHNVGSYPPKSGGIGRVRIRLDGFVSQDACWSGGSLTTVPLKFNGNRLEVNLNASAGGCLQVEILNRLGRPIPGYTRRDADRLRGNDVCRTVTWNGRSDLACLKGKRIRLRFIGRGVKLFAFEFADAG